MLRKGFLHTIEIIGILFCLAFFSCTSESSGLERRIIVIQSYEPGYKGYAGLENKILHEFHKNKINASIKTFYLDCESFLAAEELERIYNFIDTTQSWKPEVIVVYDDQATYSLLSCKHPLITRIPVLFAGVNYPNWPLLKKFHNVTGFWDKPEYMKTASMSDTLFGPTCIKFWEDQTYLGKQTTESIIKDLYENGIRLYGNNHIIQAANGTLYLQPDSLVKIDMKEVVYKKPTNTFYYGVDSRASTLNNLLWNFSGLARNSTFVQSKRDFTSKRIGLFADNPTLTVINEGFGQGEGLLGGYLTSQEDEIKLSIKETADILNGKDIGNMSIKKTPKKFVLDWKEVERWDIPVKIIPKEYHFINMPFYEQYRSHLIVGSILLGFTLFSIISYLTHLYLRENRKRKLAQDKLAKGERFLSLALAGGKVFAFQLQGDLFHFDADFYTSAKLERERPITIEEFRACVYPEDIDRFNEEVRNALLGNIEENISRIRCKFSGKDYQWWEYRYNYNKEENTFSGLCLNIQQAKEAEQELINARKKAEESDKMKSAFLANMSHEIRTPLNAIVGFSNLIGTNEVELGPEEKSEFLKLINTNCDLLLKLINDILDLSRIESGRMEFSFATCNLTELFNEIYKTHKLLMPEGVCLKIEKPQEPVMIWTDHHRLTQVITNFINNAGKFTKDGYIKIGYCRTEDPTIISLFVEDTGIGIPKEKQQSVFERFNKLDEFAQGTGLGLAICKVIVKRFGGSIQLTSTEGKGSCFTINLPLQYQGR